jgi:hypothetical protein
MYERIVDGKEENLDTIEQKNGHAVTAPAAAS